MIDPPAGTPAVTYRTVADRLAALVGRLVEIDAGHDRTAADVAKLRSEVIPVTDSGGPVVSTDELEGS